MKLDDKTLGNPEWWDENELPPKGARCEVQMGSYWYAGEVIGKTKEAIWFKSDERSDYWTIMSALSCRPIRTKEQKEREELVKIVGLNLAGDPDQIADALIEAGYHK